MVNIFKCWNSENINYNFLWLIAENFMAVKAVFSDFSSCFFSVTQLKQMNEHIFISRKKATNYVITWQNGIRNYIGFISIFNSKTFISGP